MERKEGRQGGCDRRDIHRVAEERYRTLTVLRHAPRQWVRDTGCVGIHPGVQVCSGLTHVRIQFLLDCIQLSHPETVELLYFGYEFLHRGPQLLLTGFNESEVFPDFRERFVLSSDASEESVPEAVIKVSWVGGLGKQVVTNTEQGQEVGLRTGLTQLGCAVAGAEELEVTLIATTASLGLVHYMNNGQNWVYLALS